MMRIRFNLTLVLAALIFGSLPLHAQQNVGRFVGTISDPSGAVVPGADVVAI